MATVSSSGLGLEELQKLANDPDLARHSLASVVLTLNSDDEETRGWAVEALENMGPPSAESATALVGWTRDNSILVASWACKLIGRLEEQANRYQGDLSRLIQLHESISVRQEAAAALSRIGKLNAQTCGILTNAADCDDHRLKRLIAAALANSA